MFSPHEYAGCGCTSLATYAGPRFVTAPAYAYAYGVEPEKTETPEGSSKVKVLLVGLGMFAFLYTMHRGLGGFSPPSEVHRKSTEIPPPPRKYRLPR